MNTETLIMNVDNIRFVFLYIYLVAGVDTAHILYSATGHAVTYTVDG